MKLRPGRLGWGSVAVGLALVIGGGFTEGYLSGVMLEIGAAFLLLPALVWAERRLEQRIEAQQSEVAPFEGTGERLAGVVIRRRHSESLIPRGTLLNTPDTQITFFDVYTRRSVKVPLKDVVRTKYERTASAGRTQARYALRGKFEGRNLTKFVGQAAFEALEIPII
jgi:hypothetical protein